MKLILQRDETSDQGTFGTLYLPDKTFVTGELPDRQNKHGISCIPAGLYECSFTYSPSFKRRTYLLMQVKDRFAIRIHSANFCGDVMKGFKSQLNGCIALGLKLGSLNEQKAVLSSKQAMTDFETLMEQKPFTLEIRDVSRVEIQKP